nr:alpha/beta fold hydrolase [uncultured Carboxylicivirga sp.]
MKMINRILMIAFLSTLFIGCGNLSKKETSERVVKAVLPASSKTVEIDGAVGKLDAVIQIPELKANQKCPVVILMHGIFSNKEFPVLVEIANRLQENGIASIRFDFNGHGESEGDFINMTVPLEIKDAIAVFTYCKKLDFASSISIVGHSQGGAVASLVGGELTDAIKSIVLLAPAAVLEDQTKEGKMMGNTFDPNNIPDYIEVYNHKVGHDYLATAQQTNIYENAVKYEGPVCLIQGKADQIVPFSYSVKYNEGYKNSTLHLLDGENHLFQKDKVEAAKIAVNFLISQLR